jgi:hypothetical protein
MGFFGQILPTLFPCAPARLSHHLGKLPGQFLTIDLIEHIRIGLGSIWRQTTASVPHIRPLATYATTQNFERGSSPS